MDFDLSKPQKLLQQSARDFLTRECPPEKVRELMATETAHDEKLWQLLAEMGWTGLTFSEENGGLGFGVVELAAVCEETGRACLPGAFLSNLLAGALIERAGNSAQKEKYLAPLVAGKLKATVAMLEESATWDAGAVKLTATRNGDDGADVFTLNGRKMFVPEAAVADVIICVARDNEQLILLPIERDAEGVAIKETPAMDATRRIYEVSFENVSVPASAPLGADGDAEGALQTALNVATVALCAEMVGGMQWILDAAVEYAKTRQQFGRVIGSYQSVQNLCADMLLMTESARSATYYAAWALTENDPAANTAVSIAKAYCSDAAREVANKGVQVHGGIGFTWEHDLQLYYKRSKATETLFGDATFHRERLARIVIDEQN